MACRWLCGFEYLPHCKLVRIPNSYMLLEYHFSICTIQLCNYILPYWVSQASDVMDTFFEMSIVVTAALKLNQAKELSISYFEDNNIRCGILLNSAPGLRNESEEAGSIPGSHEGTISCIQPLPEHLGICRIIDQIVQDSRLMELYLLDPITFV